MREDNIEVYSSGRYQIVCSVYEAPPQITLKMGGHITLRPFMLNTATCKGSRSIIGNQYSNQRYNYDLTGGLICSTHTDLDGPAFSRTNVSITVSKYSILNKKCGSGKWEKKAILAFFFQ